MKKITSILLCLAITLSLFSCATSVTTSIERPAELDLHGAETLSVLPFQTNANYLDAGLDITVSIIDLFATLATGKSHSHPKYYDQINIAERMTEEVISQFLNSNYIKLINSSSVEAAIKARKTVPCDVYLTGNISEFKNEITKTRDYRYVEKKVKEDGEIVTKKVKKYYTKYRREVSFYVSYKIIDAQTDRITSSKSHFVSETSSYYEDSDSIPSALNLVKSNLTTIAGRIMRQIQPYYETKVYKLTKDKTKDEQMKTANKLAKNGQLRESQKLFNSLYTSYHYPEALYNSAILLAALHDFYSARQQLEEYISINPSKDASRALADVNNEIASYERLNRQKSERDLRKNPKAKNKTKKTEVQEPVTTKKDTPAPEPSKKGIFTADDDIEDF